MLLVMYLMPHMLLQLGVCFILSHAASQIGCFLLIGFQAFSSAVSIFSSSHKVIYLFHVRCHSSKKKKDATALQFPNFHSIFKTSSVYLIILPYLLRTVEIFCLWL